MSQQASTNLNYHLSKVTEYQKQSKEERFAYLMKKEGEMNKVKYIYTYSYTMHMKKETESLF